MQDYNPSEEVELRLYRAMVQDREDGSYLVTLNTSRGPILGELYVSQGSKGAILWSASGRPGPSNPRRPAVYSSLARELADEGITSLRLFFRTPGAEPGPFEECVLDILGGVSFLKGVGAARIAVVGHSFSAAVAIKAATLSDKITGVAAIASQLYGTYEVERLAPRPLLLIHGLDDTTIDHLASRMIFDKAGDPKEAFYVEGAGHSFREKPDEIKEILRRWLIEQVGPEASQDT
ncbi:MAG: alpha/beta hydrolase [Dehalococcoidia bacterium]|nr:alpha/beta hydrolase [Dehalococcoidia bacterium]